MNFLPEKLLLPNLCSISGEKWIKISLDKSKKLLFPAS